MKSDPDAPTRPAGVRNLIFIGLGFGALVGLVAITSSHRPTTNVVGQSAASSDSDGDASSVSSVAAAILAHPAWVYSDDVDPITSRRNASACVTSLNEVSQDAPYEDVHGELCLRQGPRYGLQAIIMLEGDGQILCDISDGCTLPVRFESGAPRRFGGESAADGSTNVVFISNAGGFLKAVKAAHSVTAEIRLYQNGDQTLLFPTFGLKWPPPAS